MTVKFMEKDGRCHSLGEEGFPGGVVRNNKDATCIDVAEDVSESLLEHEVYCIK